MATPDTCASNEKPWKPRNCWNMSASSSEVRSDAVAMRQWSTSSWSLKSPMTVWVLPQSIANSMSGLLGVQIEGEVERRRRLRDHAGGDQVGARIGVGAHGLEGHAPRDLDEEAGGRGGARQRHAGTHQFGGHVVEQDHHGAGRDRLLHLFGAV